MQTTLNLPIFHPVFKIIRLFLISTLSLPSLALPIPAQAQTLSATLLSIGDGDTIRVKTPKETLTIRLACIDAPEMAQSPYGQAARLYLQGLLATGQKVSLQVVDLDRYGRTVAKVLKGDTSVNLQMVQAGHAVVYRQYLKGCPDLEKALLDAEDFAKLQKIGFWNQPKPVMPWDFRKGGSPSKPADQSKQTKPASRITGQIPACVKTDCNCSDFKSQAQAQQVLEAFPGDPFRLDADKDGIACESLK